MEKELIVGQCENCGADYKVMAIAGDVKCEKCGKMSENWDTPNAPQMAPSIVEIIK